MLKQTKLRRAVHNSLIKASDFCRYDGFCIGGSPANLKTARQFYFDKNLAEISLPKTSWAEPRKRFSSKSAIGGLKSKFRRNLRSKTARAELAIKLVGKRGMSGAVFFFEEDSYICSFPINSIVRTRTDDGKKQRASITTCDWLLGINKNVGDEPQKESSPSLEGKIYPVRLVSSPQSRAGYFFFEAMKWISEQYDSC